MRPQSIVMFDRLFLASLALSVLSFAIGYQAMIDALATDATVQQAGLGSGFLIGSAVAGYVIYLILWYLISRRATNWARWVLVVLLAFSLVSVPRALAGTLSPTVLLGLAVYALQILAVVYLFRADAGAWLRGEPESDPNAND